MVLTSLPRLLGFLASLVVFGKVPPNERVESECALSRNAFGLGDTWKGLFGSIELLLVVVVAEDEFELSKEGLAEDVLKRPYGFFRGSEGADLSLREEEDDGTLTFLLDRGTSSERVLDLDEEAGFEPWLASLEKKD